jgi:CheY-like chemotaxis protein
MNKLSILLVEDNEGDIVLTSALLSQLTILNQLSVVKDGAAAIDFILKNKQYSQVFTPDLIVLDINLPKVNGKEVLSFIKGNDHFKSIPVIIYSTSNLESEIEECYEKEANLYLTKAASIIEFTQTREHLEEFMMAHFQKPNRLASGC